MMTNAAPLPINLDRPSGLDARILRGASPEQAAATLHHALDYWAANALNDSEVAQSGGGAFISADLEGMDAKVFEWWSATPDDARIRTAAAFLSGFWDTSSNLDLAAADGLFAALGEFDPDSVAYASALLALTIGFRRRKANVGERDFLSRRREISRQVAILSASGKQSGLAEVVRKNGF